MVYNLVDLFLRSLSEKDLSQGWIVFVDTLGFLSFLALLIANGIVASHGPRYHEGHTFLLAYSSVPWLISWYVNQLATSCRFYSANVLIFASSIHGLILLKEIPQMLITDHARHICTNCGCDTNTTSKKPINRSHYSQVVRDYDPKEDVENNAPSKIGNEPSPTRESLESTNENSRLFTSSGY